MYFVHISRFFHSHTKKKQTSYRLSGCKTTDSKNVPEKLKILNGGELVHKSGLEWGKNT